LTVPRSTVSRFSFLRRLATWCRFRSGLSSVHRLAHGSLGEHQRTATLYCRQQHFSARGRRDDSSVAFIQFQMSKSRRGSALPRRGCARVLQQSHPRCGRGRRECRVFCCTRSFAYDSKKVRKLRSPQVSRATGHSLRVGLRLISRSPRCP